MEEGFPLHLGHCCFLQHQGAQMTTQSPRCCPQHHHHSPLVEGVSVTPFVVLATQVIVQAARMGTEGLFHTLELDVAQPVVQMISLLVAFAFEK